MTWQVVATRHAHNPSMWDNPTSILQARREYNAGTHTMAHRRVGNVVQLVKKELKTPTIRSWYFQEDELSA